MPMSLSQVMAGKASEWSAIHKKHNLADTCSYEQLFGWAFGDACLGGAQGGSEWFCNTTKLRQAGFHGQCIDTATMFIDMLDELANSKVIPRYPDSRTYGLMRPPTADK